jgi:pyrroline-5-carboxylate reductase
MKMKLVVEQQRNQNHDKMCRRINFGIIGYGKMGSSLIRGAIKSGLLYAPSIKIFDMDSAKAEIARKDGLNPVNSLAEVSYSEAILIAVKPKDMPELLDTLKPLISATKPLIITIAAGIRLETYASRLGEGARVVRVMPNIAASVNEAASVYVLNKWVSTTDATFIDALLNSVGRAFKLQDESMIDAVTGISGSGPAYFFYMMKALEAAGKKVSLPEDLVHVLVAQTCKGSGALALGSDLSQDQLITMVASAGGTTEEALKVMDAKGLSATMIEAVVAAIEKSKKMSRS